MSTISLLDDEVTTMGYVPISTEETLSRRAMNERFESILIPRGGVMLWYGDANAIPTGWAICNGQNGTPDLRGRFALGASDKYALGATGGEETHTLTIAEMPRHYHKFPLGRYQGNGSGIAQRETGVHTGDYDYTGDTGEGQPHNNMPPYLALYYIMKL